MQVVFTAAKGGIATQCQVLADSGFIAVTINYRQVEPWHQLQWRHCFFDWRPTVHSRTPTQRYAFGLKGR